MLWKKIKSFKILAGSIKSKEKYYKDNLSEYDS